MKHGVCIIILLLLLMAVTACADRKPTGNSSETNVTTYPIETATATPTPTPLSVLDLLLGDRPKPIVTPAGEISPAVPTATPTLTPTPTPLPLVDGMEEITWCLYPWNRPDPETQNRINQLLEAKGCNCRVRFVCMNFLTDENLTEWLENYEQKNGSIDILNAGAWSSTEAANTFAESHFLPLNDLLASEEGRTLRALWSDGAWARVTSADGTVYAIPRANTKTAVSSCFNAGIYITVSEEYREYFANFDGTYQSLRDIYNSIGQADLMIEISCGFTDRLMNALMGYQDYAGIPYDPKDQKFVNLANSDELTNLLTMVKGDLEQGITVHRTGSIDWSAVMDVQTSAGGNDSQGAAADGRKALAVIHEGICRAQDGFFELCMAEDPYYYNCALSYGINRNSEKKDLAAAILYTCYSDPEIASLLNPDSDDFTHTAERLTVTAEEHAGLLAGFADYAAVKGYPAVNELIDQLDPAFGYADEIPETVPFDTNTYARSRACTEAHTGGISTDIPVRFIGAISPNGKTALSATIIGRSDRAFNISAKTTFCWLDTATGICGSPIYNEAPEPNTADGLAACVRYGFLSNDTRFIYKLSSEVYSCLYNEDMMPVSQLYLTSPLVVVVK